MAPKDAPPPKREETDQAASGRPVGVGANEDIGVCDADHGVGWPTFSASAAQLLDNGYEPLPIVPSAKKPALSRWSSVPIDERAVERWATEFPHHGIGLRTGALVGLDIDILDPNHAHRLQDLAIHRLGDTLIRIGQWPKRLLLYRTATPAPKRSVGKVELLGLGQQFVAFGMHPDAGRPYDWPGGDTPLDVPLSDLPLVDDAGVNAFLSEASALLPEPAIIPGARRSSGASARQTPGPVRDTAGAVIDGRDGWLSGIAFHAVHDALEAEWRLAIDAIAARVWTRFVATTDLTRPRKGGACAYSLADARAKVADKTRLLAEGRLPPRDTDPVEAPDLPDAMPVATARAALDETIGAVVAGILDWHAGPRDAAAPQIGIKATVGLGKSVAARRHLLDLRVRLAAIGAPDRIAVLTPSHRLAEEAAAEWRRDGARVAVHRGYDRTDPVTGEPMCRDLGAVKAAIAAGAPVHTAACDDGEGRRCAHFATCAKQANRRQVADADVVVAAYDALYTGFAAETSSFGALLIDEACWPRARRDADRIDLDRFASVGLAGLRARGGGAIPSAAATADLHDLRTCAASAMTRNGPGPLRRSILAASSLSAEDCRVAAALERRRLRDPGLRPGSSPEMRAAAAGIAGHNEEVRRHARLWRALAAFIDHGAGRSGRIRLVAAGRADGALDVVVEGFHRLHKNLRDIPVLHLDATLRPELARAVLPRLRVTEIAAAAPHMSLRLVTGGFGKTALIGDPRASADENRRRGAKLGRCVDYVAWQAKRAPSGRTLVVTYKDCEAAFADIPGVETAHFNAVAGLDRWRGVARLIVIGRPLPRDAEAGALAGAVFDHAAGGGYRRIRKGVVMRDGAVRGVSTLCHGDDRAETIRAAICDDELIQAIGRGRGVNRIAGNPLEVHVLADVALPLVHDSLIPWDVAAPDIVQRMLLAGVAVDGPRDAAALHPTIFANEKQAEKAFERAAFNRHSPMSISYRDLSLKSAAYRLPGKGRSWRRAYWLDGPSTTAFETLTAALGALAEWRPSGD